jgi:hypothetical protein
MWRSTTDGGVVDLNYRLTTLQALKKRGLAQVTKSDKFWYRNDWTITAAGLRALESNHTTVE